MSIHYQTQKGGENASETGKIYEENGISDMQEREIVGLVVEGGNVKKSQHQWK